MTNCRRHSGFTMLELLLAMAMMGVLAVSLYASLRVAFKARDSAMNAITPVRAAQIAVDLIRGDIESALPPTGVMAAEFLAQFGVETPNASTIRFYCSATDPVLPSGTMPQPAFANVQQQVVSGGIRRVELSVALLPDGTMGLVRRTTTNLLPVMEPLPQEEVLCRGVRTFLLRFFDGFVWQDFWDSTQMGDVLPMAVEMVLELDRPGAGPDEPPYRVARLFTLPCHDVEAATGTGMEGGGF
jgi:prepilin-type N-terminal cleavage/methylation domain-containing protein